MLQEAFLKKRHKALHNNILQHDFILRPPVFPAIINIMLKNIVTIFKKKW